MNNKKQLAMALLIMGSANAMQNQDGNTGPSIRQLQFEEDKQPERMKPLSPRAEKPLPILQQTQLYPQNQAKRDIDSNKQMAPRSEMRSKSAKGPGDSDADALYQAKLEQIRLKLTVVVDDQKARFDEDKAKMEKKIQKHSSAITQYKQRNAALQAQIDQHNSEIQQKQKTFEIEKQKIQEKNEDLQKRLDESQQEVVQLSQEVADADGNILKERTKNQKHLKKYRGYGDELINLNPEEDGFLNKLKELQTKLKARKDTREKRQEDFRSMLSDAETGKTFAEDNILKQTMDPRTAQKYKEVVQHIRNRYPEGVDTSESEDERDLKKHLKALKAQKFLTPEDPQALKRQVYALDEKVSSFNIESLSPDKVREQVAEYKKEVNNIRESGEYKELKKRDRTKIIDQHLEPVEEKLLQHYARALWKKILSVNIQSLLPYEVREKIVEYINDIENVRGSDEYKKVINTFTIDIYLALAEEGVLELQVQALWKKVSSVNIQSLLPDEVREKIVEYINDIENVRGSDYYKRVKKENRTQTVDRNLENVEKKLLELQAEALDEEVADVVGTLSPEQVARYMNEINEIKDSEPYKRLNKRGWTTMIDYYLELAKQSLLFHQARTLDAEVSRVVNIESLSPDKVREKVAGYMNERNEIRDSEDYKRLKERGWTTMIDDCLNHTLKEIKKVTNNSNDGDDSKQN